MAKLVALYKKPENPADFDDKYFNTHIPLANKIPGLKKCEVSRIEGSPMGESEYYLMAELYFENMDALKAGMSSPEGRESGKNLMSFAKDVTYMMFAEEAKVPATV